MIADFVLETANAPGTGQDVRLGGAKQGRRTWRSAYADGSPVFYYIDDGTQAEWGIGTFHLGSPDILTRATVGGNTQSNTNRLNFTGAVDVYNEIIAKNTVYVDGNNILKAPTGVLFDTLSGATPIGSGTDFWGTVPPSGWLFAAGQQVSRTTYAKLFAVIGTTLGAGDGSTTFNVPDKRGRSSFGLDNMGGVGAASRINTVIGGTAVGQSGGNQSMQQHNHGLTINDGGHVHGISDPGHAHGVGDPGHVHTYVHSELQSLGYQTGASNFANVSSLDNTLGSLTGVVVFPSTTGIFMTSSPTNIAITMAQTGSGLAQNMPPCICCNYIIFAGA